MTHKEIHGKLQDYALGLLSPGQSQQIREHLATCTTCCQIVHEERALGTLVRSTIATTSVPDKGRLQSLMPAIPHSSNQHYLTNWSGRLAPALVVLLLIAGGLLMLSSVSQRQMSFFGAVTATATSTQTPTATLIQESNAMHPQTSALTNDLHLITLAVQPALRVPIPALPTPAKPPTPAAATITVNST